MKTISINDGDVDVYVEDCYGDILEGEWTCYDCDCQNEIEHTTELGEVVECERCRQQYKVVD